MQPFSYIFFHFWGLTFIWSWTLTPYKKLVPKMDSPYSKTHKESISKVLFLSFFWTSLHVKYPVCLSECWVNQHSICILPTEAVLKSSQNQYLCLDFYNFWSGLSIILAEKNGILIDVITSYHISLPMKERWKYWKKRQKLWLFRMKWTPNHVEMWFKSYLSKK